MASSAGKRGARLIEDSSSSGSDTDDGDGPPPPPAKRVRLSISESPASSPDTRIAKTEVRVVRDVCGGASSSAPDTGADSSSSDSKPSSRPSRSWPDIILPEILGTISSFLPLPSVPSLLVTAGPILSVLLRKAYLRRNYTFLGRALEMEYGRCLEGLDMWMDVNDDWRDMYGPVQPVVTGTSRSVLQWLGESAEEPRTLSRRRAAGAATGEGGEDRDGCESADSMAASAAGRPSRPSAAADRDLFDRIFDDVTVAVRLGLVSVVQHLVEQRRGDVNERVRISAPAEADGENNEGDNDEDPEERAARRRGEERVRRPLLYALFLPSPAVLHYLLTVPDLRVNFPVLDSAYGCKVLHLAAVGDDVPPPHLSALLSHPDASVDVRDSRGRTPLHYVCHFAPADCVERVRVLVGAGADVTAEDGFGRTPLQVLERERREEEGGEDGQGGDGAGAGAADGGDEGDGERRAGDAARIAMAQLLRVAAEAAAAAEGEATMAQDD